MVYRHIHSAAIRGTTGILCPPCPRAEAANEGDDLESDTYDRFLTFCAIGNDH